MRASPLEERIVIKARSNLLRRMSFGVYFHREITPAKLNPIAVNWYAELSFELEVTVDDMSVQAPWLFGPQGLYPTQYVPKCELPCQVIDGVCVSAPNKFVCER